MICTKCNESFKGLALKAILVDLGCKVHPSPNICIDGDEHDFETHEKEQDDGPRD